MKILAGLVIVAVTTTAGLRISDAASVKPDDLITPENASAVADLVSPGNLYLVKQGMRMKIVPADHIDYPTPYKNATEKYSPQVSLGSDGELRNYVAGLPFPLVESNDPQAALKVMWNFAFRPQYTDDVDIRDVEGVSHQSAGGMRGPVIHFTVGHFAYYNNVGRTEIPPIPTGPDATEGGILYRFGAFPFLEPEDFRGVGLLRWRYKDPNKDDTAFIFVTSAGGFHIRQDVLSDAGGPVTIDPDSFFGFSPKIEDYTYKLLGVRPMLAVVHAAKVPEPMCQFDNQRTVCPENWEMRQLYIVEATAKPRTWGQKIGSSGVVIPKRILYIDSEGWFITASDQYDPGGKLWKTLATFNAYRDRPVPDAKVAIYPFKRMFQTAMVDEDVTTGFSTVLYMPGHESEDRDCWYINMGLIPRSLLTPQGMLSNARGESR